jgi:hypothetical protein
MGNRGAKRRQQVGGSPFYSESGVLASMGSAGDAHARVPHGEIFAHRRSNSINSRQWYFYVFCIMCIPNDVF